MGFSLVPSLVKVVIRCVGDGLTGGLIPIGSIAVGVYEELLKGDGPAPVPGEPSPVAQARLRAELEKISQDSRAYRKEVEATLAQMTQDEAVKQRALAYLSQVPGRIQASLRRPDDPSGRTVPPGLSLRRADDLKQFLPDRMPRFKPGDSPVPGIDLVVEELLGIGGFGEVWRAVHKRRPHAAPVALKFCTDESAARSLRKELDLLDRAFSQGRHNGIVELKTAYFEGDTPCLVYEYVDGGDLAALIPDLHRSGKANPLQMSKILCAIAQAVGFAHRLKPPIVHRDLKPQNILVTRSEGKAVFKVADFGIGGLASDQAIREWSGETKSGVSPGALTQSAGSCTPLYASRQQRRFGPPDPRDDVYALGVIWFQMLTGDVSKEPPRGGGWKKKCLAQGATEEMIGLLERCIEDEAADRPADAQVLADELVKLLRVPAGGAAAPAAPTAAPAAQPAAPAEDWYFARNGQQHGPVKLDQLRQLAAAGQLGPKDLVWTAKLGNWAEAGTIKGLCPELPVAPLLPPPVSTTAKVHFIVPPSGDAIRDAVHTAAKAYIKIASYGLLGGKLLGEEIFKFYFGSRLIGEGSLKQGFDFQTEFTPGAVRFEVAHWKGNKELDRKVFDLDCSRPGEYEVRFNYVKGMMGGMSGSTIEILKDPTFAAATRRP